MKTIDDVIQKLEYIMESDPRTFSNPECEYAWAFHRINEAIKMLKEIENDLPSAQPRMKGRWMNPRDGGWALVWDCSECGEHAISRYDGYPKFKFCPMCGADMRGGGEG